MRIRFYILATLLLSAPYGGAAEDPLIARAMPEIARFASEFWHNAPDFIARETMKQKAITAPKRHMRLGAKATEQYKPAMKEREIVSFYSISFFNARREALREFREIVSIDGKDTGGAAARNKLRSTMESKNDKAKQALMDEFEKSTIGVASPTDFGQLILLFTRANLAKYNFDLKPRAQIGADRALVIAFRQKTGGEALRINDSGQHENQPLSGELWVRESDYQPLRITLSSTHLDEGQEIRDEARVDYVSQSAHVFLPASIVHRRFIKNIMAAENIAEYSDWQPVNLK